MTGSRLRRLPEPLPRHDIALLCPRRIHVAKTKRRGKDHYTGFETLADAASEDIKRVASLERLLRSGRLDGVPISAKQIEELIEDINNADDSNVCLASSYSMRFFRRKVTGSALSFLEAVDLEVKFATIVSPKWVVNSYDLPSYDLNKIFADLRVLIDRTPPYEGGGFLIMSLHNELEPNSERYFLHLHCAAGGIVIEKLNNLRRYKLLTPSVDVDTPMRIDVINNLPEVVSYLWKSYSLSRAARPADHPDGKYRQKYGTRMKEPYNAIWLCKLHQSQPSDLIKFYKCEATSDGIRLR